MRELIIAIRMFLVLTVLTGVVYPVIVTGIAQTAFRDKANGSLLTQGGTVVGSRLIGQPFDDPKYFWSRPSATAPFPYNAAASSGSNQGPLNPALVGGKDADGKGVAGALAGRVDALKAAGSAGESVPTDLVTASSSGLDPHISPAAAEYQVARVAQARGMTEQAVMTLVKSHTESRQFGIFGEPIVNVLELNLALDGASQ
ncbi:MAG: potassium-transporting ATPase subunit KdpC [Fimbriimonadaceae bacterium]|nr:potassium-transporting ATPase subunit KdpC [Fimbriimonadaceae bacterium]